MTARPRYLSGSVVSLFIAMLFLMISVPLAAFGQGHGNTGQALHAQEDRLGERGGKLPSDSPAVQALRKELIQGLIKRLQEDFPGIREATLAIGQLRSILADDEITDEEFDRARKIRNHFYG